MTCVNADPTNHRRPNKVVIIQSLIYRDDKINCITLGYFELFNVCLSGLLVQDPMAQQPLAVGNEVSPYSVAFLVLMFNRTFDSDHAVGGRDPASNDCMFGVITGVSSRGRQLRPAQSIIGPSLSALPRVARKVGQWLEAFYFFRRFIEFTVAIFPD